MSNTSIVELDPNSQEANQAVMALLGATLAELKQIDQFTVGGSANIKGIKTDLKNVFNTRAQPPVLAAAPQLGMSYAPAPAVNAVNAGLNIETVKAASPPQQSQEVQDDPNQLVFDFNKPITPDTINNKLDIILDKLNNIIDRLKT